MQNIILQKDYTLNQSGYQLKLPLNIDCIIPKDDSVRLLSQFVEEMDLADLYSTYQRIPGNLSPRTILKVMIYAYMNGIIPQELLKRTAAGILTLCTCWKAPPRLTMQHLPVSIPCTLHRVLKRSWQRSQSSCTVSGKFQGKIFLSTGQRSKRMRIIYLCLEKGDNEEPGETPG